MTVGNRKTLTVATLLVLILGAVAVGTFRVRRMYTDHQRFLVDLHNYTQKHSGPVSDPLIKI